MDRHRRFARAEDKIARLSKQGLDMVAFWRASGPVLADAVPRCGSVRYTMDPASRLVTSHFNEEMLELPPEWIIHEYTDDDVNKLTDVARSRAGSRRCTRPPAAIPAQALAGMPSWPTAVIRK